jgi:hypothetical protein
MTLPAFLLANADCNFVWLGCKRFVIPTVNTRWSPARVLTLVAAQTALAILLGGVVPLLIAGQLWGWLIRLLGIFGASQSIVMVGLMALCWNQRVTRLGQNPDLAIGLPPARYCLGRWALGLIYFAVLGLITPLAMLITVENIYGQTAWRREHARLVAQGERLTFRELLGPEIPAEQNAGAAPIFKPFFDQAGNDGKVSAEVTNAMKNALFVPSHYLPEKSAKALRQAKRPENMAEWSAAYRKMVAAPELDDPAWAKQLQLPAPGDPARDVLAGLAMGDAIVADICTAAARPRAQFPVPWQEGFGISLQHLARMKQIQLNLQLRCAAYLAVGETNSAFATATNALNVAELLREEPLLISQLVRIADGAIAVNTLWQGLATHQWTDAQLAVFQERLGRVDYLSGLIRAFEGERVCGIVGLDALITGNVPGEPVLGAMRRAVMVVPLGMLRENQVALVRGHTAMLTDLRAHIAQAPQAGFAASAQALAKQESARNAELAYLRYGTPSDKRLEGDPSARYSPFTALARMLLPALARAETKAARGQTVNHLAITACALERHRLAHGSYPETLDALLPAFLPKPLLDPMTAQPFHYRRTDDGWFLLYSVGEDGQDDGGVFRAKAKGPILDWPWPVPTRPDEGSLF